VTNAWRILAAQTVISICKRNSSKNCQKKGLLVQNHFNNTHTCLTAFVWDYPGGPVPEETFTHSHPCWSSDILYHLPPSTMIYSILLVQFACLTVLFHNLSPGPLWSYCWSGNLYVKLHTFLHPITFFSQHMPIPSQPVLLQYQCYVIYKITTIRTTGK